MKRAVYYTGELMLAKRFNFHHMGAVFHLGRMLKTQKKKIILLYWNCLSLFLPFLLFLQNLQLNISET